jgi:hypothetical protein
LKKFETKIVGLVLALAAGLLVTACTDRKPIDLVNPNFHQQAPRTIAVLPMDNMSPDLDATPLVRPIVQQRMVYKGYNCVPLDKIDAMLKEKGVMVSHDVYMFKPQELGELLGVDAVVYGTITEFNKHYAVLYADILVGIQLEMVDTRTGESLWKSEHVSEENTALLNILLIATQLDDWQKALAEVAIANAAFAALSQYRPYAEDAARQTMQSLPNGPMGERNYPWDFSQATWADDIVIGALLAAPVIISSSPKMHPDSHDRPPPPTGHGPGQPPSSQTGASPFKPGQGGTTTVNKGAGETTVTKPNEDKSGGAGSSGSGSKTDGSKSNSGSQGGASPNGKVTKESGAGGSVIKKP